MFRHAATRQGALPSSRAVSLSRPLRAQSRSLHRCHASLLMSSWPLRGARSRVRSQLRASPPVPATGGSVRGAASLSFADDTIYALSSAQGKAAIAVIRVSGPKCLEVYRALCPSGKALRPRYAAVRTLYDPEVQPSEKGNILDSDAVVLYFPAPRTATGEDVLELHVHGGPATVRAVLSAIPRCCPGPDAAIRYAEPGEFTRRAFLNDRLDLAQVESLSDALAAETEQQRRAAVRGSSGALGRAYEAWREQLLLARGEIEALIDFSEDQHFDESPAELLGNVAALVRGILRSIAVHEAAGERNELLRNGIRIALLGPPNVGKSSLMNLIVGREASIVSHEAGTTRDIVEASLDIRGYLCTFADTAGFRSTPAAQSFPPSSSSQEELSTSSSNSSSSIVGAVEQEGIRRARQRAVDSDLVIVLASIESDDGGASFHIRYDAETLGLAARAQQRVVVINKCDAVGDAAALDALVSDFRDSVLAGVSGLLDTANSGGADVDTTTTSSSTIATSALGEGAEPRGTRTTDSAPMMMKMTRQQPLILISCKEEAGANDAGAEAEADGHSSTTTTTTSTTTIRTTGVGAGAGAGAGATSVSLVGLHEEKKKTRQEERRSSDPRPGSSQVAVGSPGDIGGDDDAAAAATAAAGRGGGGIRALVDRLARSFGAMTSVPAGMQDLLGVTERQRQLLARCRQHLEDFMAEAGTNERGEREREGEADIVLAAEHLRHAANCLARITGRGEAGDIEEVLGVIFEKFCVGK